jgi:competence protein ComEC
MHVFLLLFSAGVLTASLLPSLPSLLLFIVFILAWLILAMVIRRPGFHLLLAMGGGLLWGTGYGLFTMHSMLPVEMEGQDTLLRGRVCGLPHTQVNFQREVRRFQLCLHAPAKDKNRQGLPVLFNRVLLSWYDGQPVVPGQQWQLLVRSKRPRGFVNPAGFDYQVWLAQHGIDATGYVREDSRNRVLEQSPVSEPVSAVRFRLRQQLASLQEGFANTDIINALVIGDKSRLGSERWRVLTRTGTNHLMVVSGLHVGLVALLVYWLTNWLVRLPVFPLLWRPAENYAALAATIAAFAYGALAGFSLPTLRACIMVVAVMLGRLLCRTIPAPLAWCLALTGVLLVDPLAGQSMGFWFSFAAVAALMFLSVPRCGGIGGWQRWVLPQVAVFLVLAPLLAINFGQVSLLSPLANLLAIPIMSFIVVPLCLLGAASLLFSERFGSLLLGLADLAIDKLWLILEYLADSFPALLVPLATDSSALVAIALVGTVLLLAPRGLPLRCAGALLCLPLLWPLSLESYRLRVTALDVGQGLAVLVETKTHNLLYDTGPRYSARFDAGSGVIAPMLRARRIHYLDRLVLSHADSDHVGGMAGVLDNIEVGKVSAGDRVRQPGLPACRAGESWSWDGVDFAFLHPPGDYYGKGNNRSCVLLIRTGFTTILLPGDIEATIERRLIEQHPELRGTDVVIAPHHGSKTSSTASFIRYLAPRYGVFSAGYRSRFNHPHPRVVERYRENGVTLLNTADRGAIEFVVDKNGVLAEPVGERQRRHRYWYW